LTANSSFQFLAFSTVDGSVHFFDANNGASLVRFDTKREIIQIIITSAWGFVIALSLEEPFCITHNRMPL
jgi:hypothetical protein